MTYATAGAGDLTLLLIHGYTGSKHDFAPHVDALGSGRRVIRVDLAGHGESEHRAEYSTAALTGELIEFLDVVGGPVHLLGHSMGGRIALELVLARPDLVSSLILMCTTYTDFGLNRPEAERQARLRFAACGEDDRSPDDPAQRLYLESVDDAWMLEQDSVKSRLDPLARQQLGAEIFGGGLASLESRLADIATPTTVMTGSLDLPYVEPSRVMTTSIPHARAAVIEGAYHVPQLTHGSTWLSIVDDHIDGTRAR